MKLSFSTNETPSSFSSPQSTCQDKENSDEVLVSLPSMPMAAMSTMSQPEVESVTSESAYSLGCFLQKLCYLPTNHQAHFLLTNVTFPFPFSILGLSRSSTPSTLASDPATCPIIPGCETTIDISKGRTGLGLSIVGGCDTLLVGDKKYENKSTNEAVSHHQKPPIM